MSVGTNDLTETEIANEIEAQLISETDTLVEDVKDVFISLSAPAAAGIGAALGQLNSVEQVAYINEVILSNLKLDLEVLESQKYLYESIGDIQQIEVYENLIQQNLSAQTPFALGVADDALVDAFKSLDKYVVNATTALGFLGIAIDSAAIVAHLSNGDIDQTAKTIAGIGVAFLAVKTIALGVTTAVSFVGASTLATALSSVTVTTAIAGVVAYGAVSLINWAWDGSADAVYQSIGFDDAGDFNESIISGIGDVIDNVLDFFGNEEQEEPTPTIVIAPTPTPEVTPTPITPTPVEVTPTPETGETGSETGTGTGTGTGTEVVQYFRTIH